MVDDDDFDGPLTRNVLRDRLVNSKRFRMLAFNSIKRRFLERSPAFTDFADYRGSSSRASLRLSVGPSHPPTLSLLFGSATFFH